MHIRGMEIEFCGNLVVRQVQPHEIQAQYPHPKGLMMTGEDRVRQIVEASLTGLAQVALTFGLSIVPPCLVIQELLQAGQRVPSGQRRARTVSKHLASSMRD